MVIWGAIWGAILGLLWHGSDEGAQMFFGAVLGAIAGWTLRRSVRKEVARQVAAQKAAPAIVFGVPAAVAKAPSRTAPTELAAAAETAPAPAESSAPSGPAFEPPVPTAAPSPTLAPALTSPPAEPNFAQVLVTRAMDWLFGGNTVVRMGVVVLFVGLAFLARYAVENALLPPALRLALIAGFGLVLFVFGIRLRGRAPDKLGYSLTMQGAGIAVLYLTVFAAFRLYQFLPAGGAFGALALICLFSAVIAVAQNAQVLAFIGFAGGFAAPVLVSTGQGSHVSLFSYYLLLGVAIAGLAWWKAWRALNLLGFFATFGVATAWGVLRYVPEHRATTEPFLIAFFATYLVASLLYALRHGQAARRAVDATLVFGTPIVAFGLQAALVRDIPYATAFSSLALGAVYLVLAFWMLRRRGGDALVHRWLAECFVALALGFITLAVPLALDGRWTAAVWAVEGAGVYWMGRRQARWLPRAAGLALQALAAVLYLDGLTGASSGHWPIANPAFVGAAMLAGAAFALAWWSREPLDAPEASRAAQGFGRLEDTLSPVLFWIGVLWWQAALSTEIERLVVNPDGIAQHVFDRAGRKLLFLVGWVGSAYVLHRLALPARAKPWPVAATPAWFNLPVMLAIALWGMATQNHVFQSGGWIAWPLVVVLHLAMLRALDAGRPAAWWPWVHAGGVWLAVLLFGNLLVFAIGRAQLWQTAWATVILLVAGSGVLLALVNRKGFEAEPGTLRWPFDRFAPAYLWRAAAPLAVALAFGALAVAVLSDGDARPLPYLPLVNPTDLAVALALGVCALWLLRLHTSVFAVPQAMRGLAPAAVLAAIGFVAVNTVWLRVAHHYFQVPWDAHLLFASFVVQAGYSILWTLMALALMVGAHRKGVRLPWMLGAGLLALTVLKLFVIDLSNRGGTERIVVFIAVGLLMLVVGWFAPLPPARKAPPPDAAPLEGAAP
jgi:uncharacterized membrane protein